ncbi:MAG: hypothetical protein QUS07_03680, partial [Methanothrix sp.]|nr:hypothetical protein [Methanothrix sp.]
PPPHIQPEDAKPDTQRCLVGSEMCIRDRINAMKKQPAPPEPNTKECPYCKETIPKAAVKCSHCTSDLSA